MGGDFAPAEVVRGALLVAREDPATEIVLLGDEAAVGAELVGAGRTPREPDTSATRRR